MHQQFFGIKNFRIVFEDGTPNFGVFSDFVNPFLSEVDFSKKLSDSVNFRNYFPKFDQIPLR